MISVSNLRKDYSDDETTTHALRDVSFDIQSGEFVAIMGPSGSGKSTLLHILSFLDRPTHGVYTFLGKSIRDLSDRELAVLRNQDMGFVFQAFNLMARSTVFENVLLPLLYAPALPQGKREKLVREAVHAVGLSHKLRVHAGKLSGGEKQRVAIARALVNGPRVIFADEPTGNLDSRSGAQVMEILHGLHRKGRTIILVTHETYTAEFANRLITLKDGYLESDQPILHSRERKEEFFK